MNSLSFCRPLALLLALSVPAFGADGGSSGASVSSSAADGQGIDKARTAISGGDYSGALKHLVPVVKKDPKNADAWNLMGYSSRHLKHYNEAAKYYDIALRINPRHTGALEYQGELFVETGQFDKAKQNLKMLRSICGTCEEALDLQAALQAKGQS